MGSAFIQCQIIGGDSQFTTVLKAVPERTKDIALEIHQREALPIFENCS